MNQHKATSEIIEQLIHVTGQFDDESFMQPLEVLSGNTCGKHVRHIIEFYNCLLQGYNSGFVNYDTRAHNRLIESNTYLAIAELKTILSAIRSLEDKSMLLMVDYSGEGHLQSSHTSFHRELVYNLEHAIHHMAIIKIAVKESFDTVRLPDNFGVAHSTISYQEKQCAQ